MTYSEAVAQWQNMRNALTAFAQIGEVLDLAAQGAGQAETLKRTLAEVGQQIADAEQQKGALAGALAEAKAQHAADLEALRNAWQAKNEELSNDYYAQRKSLQEAYDRADALYQQEVSERTAALAALTAQVAAKQLELADLTKKTEDARGFLKSLQVAAAG
jgi:chromosome segregation ATPase